MTIGDLIELIKAIFEVIAEYIGQLIGDGEDNEETDEPAVEM